MDTQCRIFSCEQLDSILSAGALKQINTTPRRLVGNFLIKVAPVLSFPRLVAL
jgi:hypothetical protein